MFWLKLIVFIVLCLVFRKLTKYQLSKWRNLKSVVAEGLKKEGWQKVDEVFMGSTSVGVYKKGVKRIVVILGNGYMDYEKIRKGLVLSALNNAKELRIYCKSIGSHAHRALEYAKKNTHVHGIEIKVWH